MPISLKAASGGGGTPYGSLMSFPLSTAPDITIDGNRYLRSGFIEKDTNLFDDNFYSLTRATVFENTGFSITGTSRFLTGSGNNLIAFYGNNFYKVSTDAGVTWGVELTFPCDVADRVVSCEYFAAGSVWVAATRGGRIYSSTNMTSWTQRYQHPDYDPADTLYYQIKAFATTVVAVGKSSTAGIITTSTNGTTYTARTISPNIGVRSVAYNGTFYMFGVVNQANGTVHALTSTDFVSFATKQIIPASTTMDNYVSFANGYWFSTPQFSGGLYRSTNGDTWTQIDKVLNAVGYVTYQDGFYQLASFARSLDTEKWIASPQYVDTAVTIKLDGMQKIGSKYFLYGDTVGGSIVIQVGNNYLYAGSPVVLNNQSSGSGASFVYYVKIKP